MSTAEVDLVTTPPPILYSVPEALFRVEHVEVTGSVVRGSMPIGGWLAEPTGTVAAGSLGVLVDDVLGYAILACRPPDHWSVSTVITLDILAGLRPSATRVHAEASALHASAQGAYSTGRVYDDDGRLVARCSQRARFIKGMEATLRSTADGNADRRDAENLLDLLAYSTIRTETGLELVAEANRALQNPSGILHGGIGLCLSDLAANQALAGTNGSTLATSSIRIFYARPISAGATVQVRPVVTYRGRSLADVEVTCSSDGKTGTVAHIVAEPAE